MSGAERAAELTVVSDIDGERSTKRFGCVYITHGSGFEIRYTEDNGDENRLRFTEQGINGGSRAEIERSGSSSGLMVIETFRTTPCCMHTPQGRLDLRVCGKSVMLKFSDNIAAAEISYIVMLGSGSTEVNYRFSVKVI
ncbi:MAG: DUF1934 domain-containing protein [Ruminococcus sp.]|nr:DUF1934 domain-containing protein [Ruminococcus sp.]